MRESFDKELAVFSEARQLPDERRAAFLDNACAGDTELRRRVEELLQASGQSVSFMETPAGKRPDLSPLSGSTVTPAEKPGDHIGHYELLAKIGEGGCGIVYKANQEQPVRRSVALKIIKLGMDTKSVIARFEAERQVLALMDHPNIAKVFDAGATDTGRPYFVMELVDGIKITDFCDQQHLSTRDRLELFIQVCHAVQHAHQKGIIHRDLKPSNVLVTITDGRPLPKIIDFGIAKATRGKLTDQTVFTALEQFIGTPAYMSPEQADAREADIDTRSDIYSLGVLLYELLTGRTPFNAEKLAQASLDEIRRTIREREPAAPSTQLSTLRGADLNTVASCRKAEAPELVLLVRGDLDWIVMKALEKDRARRYETTNGLALDIQRHLDNEPVLARPPSVAYQLQKMVRRNRLAFAAGAAIALALAVGVAMSVWASIKEHRARLEADKLRIEAQVSAQVAQANEQKAQENEQKAQANEQQAQANALKAQASEQLAQTNVYKAEAAAAKSREVAQFLEDMLQGVGPSVSMGADTTLLKKILDNTSQRLGTDLAGQPEVEAELRNTLGQVYWEIGDLTNAESMYRRALEIQGKIGSTNDAADAKSMGGLSHVLWREGKLAEAEKLAIAGISIERGIYGNTNLEVARSLEDYAAILNSRGLGGRAVSVLREALADKEALLGPDNLEVADTMDDLSGLLWSMHPHAEEGIAVGQEALAIRGKILGTNNPLVTIAALRLQACDLDLKGRSADEEATLKKLVEAKRQLYGGPHPDLAQSLNTLASVLKTENKLAESETVRREALAMQQKLLGTENTEVATTLLNLGQLLIAEDKPAEAEPLMREAFKVRRKLLGDQLSLTAVALGNYGSLLEQESKIDEATNLYMSIPAGSAMAATAEYRLGQIFLHGIGVPQDLAKGVEWTRRSAFNGHTEAQIEMGMLFFKGTGVPKDEDTAEMWFNQAADSANLSTTKAVVFTALAECYCVAGQSESALGTIKKVCDSYPHDMEALETLAAWQLWYGKKTGYETTRERVVQAVTESDSPSVVQAAAKVCCLESSSDSNLLAKALKLARLGVELRGDSRGGAWFYLSLGMVEYRSGQYDAAEKDLAQAEQSAGKIQDLLPTVRLFRAMCLFQQNQKTEAGRLFGEVESQMTPLPKNPKDPVIKGKAAAHDVVIEWLIYREAKALLYGVNPLADRAN